MMRHCAFTLRALAAFMLPVLSSAQTVSVTHYDLTPLSDADAKLILSESSHILTNKDDDDDVACPIALSLKQPPGVTVDNTVGVVGTSEEFDAVCARLGLIHVLDAINWCGDAAGGPFAGCSSAAPCMIVERLDPTLLPGTKDIEGILWAHEFGHTKGLQHRDSETAVMNPYLTPGARDVNATECSAYKRAAAPQGVKLAKPTPTAATPSPALPDIRTFVHRIYFEGVPFETASRYSAGDAQQLVGMLKEKAEEPFLANIAITLGMIGDKLATAPLIDFVKVGAGPVPVSASVLRGKLAAVTALGYIVNKTHDDTALTFLTEGLRPSAWQLAWRSAPGIDMGVNLSRSAARALGIAGSNDAMMALSKAQTDPNSSQILPTIEESLKVNRSVYGAGLVKYLQNNT